MYQVLDARTQQVISTHKTLRAASNKVDRLDFVYGASRYYYRFIK